MRELTRGGRNASIPRKLVGDFRDSHRIERSRYDRMWGRIVPRRPADAIAAAFAVAAVVAVLVNALALQRSLYPEPTQSTPATGQLGTISKRTVPATPAPVAAPVPPQRPDLTTGHYRTDLVLDIQRELAQRGYYDGAVDGLLGPRTDQAIRDFEQMQGLRIIGEPSETLLGQIRKARAKSEITGSIRPSGEPPGASQVLSVQRVLARLGYGPVRLNGISDAATRASIERFERDRNLSVSGEITDRLIRELAAVSGAPLE